MTRHLIVIYSLRGGGAERTLVNLLHRLGPDAEQIDLLIGIKGGALESEVPQFVQRNYLFRNRFLARSCFWLFRKRLFRAPLQIAWRLKVRHEYLSVVSFLDSFLTDLVADFSRTKRKVAIVHSDFERDPNFKFGEIGDARRTELRESRYMPLHAIAFVSVSARDAFVRTIGNLENFEILPILFSPREIRRLADLSSARNQRNRSEDLSSRPAPGAIQFICVGSLLPVKGHELLLEACALLVKRNYRFHLHLVGDGPLRDNLSARVRELDLSAFVTMHGFLKNPYPLLGSVDAMVLPSLSEAMPTVICEAHVLGVPVLASDCDGCRNLLGDDEFGLIFKRDASALADAMANFIDNPDVRARWRQRGQRWLDGYDEEKVLERYRELIGFSAEALPTGSRVRIGDAG